MCRVFWSAALAGLVVPQYDERITMYGRRIRDSTAFFLALVQFFYSASMVEDVGEVGIRNVTVGTEYQSCFHFDDGARNSPHGGGTAGS